MLLELNNVSKRFGGVAALTDISFGVKQGEIFGQCQGLCPADATGIPTI